jgi:hypothetical protein
MLFKINKGVPQELLFYALYSYIFYCIRFLYVHDISYPRFMISSTTPHKLAEIIRDTWPQLYRKPEASYNKQKTLKNEKVQ